MLSLSTATRVSIVFSAAFSVGAIQLPFFPLFLQHRGLNATEISVIVSLMSALRLLMGPFGVLADRSGDRRPVFVAIAGLAVLCFSLFFVVESFVGMLVATVLTMLFWNPITPIVEGVATVHAARGAGDFGRMRAWGSATFVVVTVVAGWLLKDKSPEAIPYFMGGAFLAVFLSGMLLPPVERKPTQQRVKVRYRDLFLVPGLLLTLIVSALIQGSHAMLYGFASIYWKEKGFPDDTIGVLWSTGVLAEVMIFTYSGVLSRFIKARQWLLIGGFSAAARWLLFPHVDGMLGWMALQFFHALTFGATHIGTLQTISNAVVERQSVSAQSLYGTLVALMSSLVALAAGALFAAEKGHAFAWMALLPAVALMLLAWSGVRRPAG
jgi:PPP family 3-phenylpropionic acid transporter